jgi:sortase A
MMRNIQKVLIIFGVVALLFCGGSMLYGMIFQKLESWRFDRSEASATTAEISEGEILGRLEIPDLNFSLMVLEGVGNEVLVAGAGHIPGTSNPGPKQEGNVAIAGHRDTFFRDLRRIRSGQRIRFTTSAGAFEYSVSGTEVVRPSDTKVLESHGFSELTLITCYPFSFIGSAPERFVVHARRIKGEDQK